MRLRGIPITLFISERSQSWNTTPVPAFHPHSEVTCITCRHKSFQKLLPRTVAQVVFQPYGAIFAMSRFSAASADISGSTTTSSPAAITSSSSSRWPRSYTAERPSSWPPPKLPSTTSRSTAGWMHGWAS